MTDCCFKTKIRTKKIKLFCVWPIPGAYDLKSKLIKKENESLTIMMVPTLPFKRKEREKKTGNIMVS